MTRPSPRPTRRPLLRLSATALATLLVVGAPVTTPSADNGPRHTRVDLDFAADARGAAWTTPAAAAPWSFALVGVSWRESERPEGTPALRTSADGRTWTAWQDVELQDNGPDIGSPEDSGVVATEPVWVGGARLAQLRWTGSVPPASAELHLIDPGSDPPQPASSALAAPARPGIVSRAQWGADESIRRCCPAFAPSVDFAVVHHTVTSNTYSADESSSMVRAVYEYHVRVNGWDDIGYNFLVDRFGRVFEGRFGGVREAVVGAHSEGFNRKSTGVALIGSFQSQAPSGAAMSALRNVLAWKLDVHHVDPRSSMTVVSGGSRRHPAGSAVRVNAIAAHRDLQQTTCPGDPVINALPRLRNDVYATGLPKIFRPRLTPSVFSPNGDGAGDVLRATASVSDGASWRVRVRSADNVTLRTWTGGGGVDVRWDGRNVAGAPAPHGYYKVDWTATRGSASATSAQLSAGLYRDPWGAWTAVGGALDSADAPRVAAGPNGTFHLLARDGVGGVRHARWSGGQWGTLQRLGSAGDVAASEGRLGFVADDAGVLHAVIRGRTSNLYHGRILRDGTFTGWARIGGAGDRGTDVALAADRSGAVHALIVGMSGNLYASRYRGGWSGWKRVGGSRDAGVQPALATGRGGDVLAVVVGGSSVLYANKLDPGRGWRSRWAPVGPSTGRGREPAIAPVGDGFLVVARGQSTPNVWQASGSIGRWSGWSRVGSASDAGYEPAVVGVAGDVVLVVRGRNSGRLYANVRAPDGGWRGWDEAGDSLQQGEFPTLATTGGRVMLGAQVSGQRPATILATPPLRSS